MEDELAELKQVPDYQDVEIQTDEEWVDKTEEYSPQWPTLVSSIKALHEKIEQQSQQLKDLNENNAILSSQLESQAELIRQK